MPLRIQGVEGCELCLDDRAETIAAALERTLLTGKRSNGRQAVKDLDERILTRRVIDVYRSVLTGRRETRLPRQAGSGVLTTEGALLECAASRAS